MDSGGEVLVFELTRARDPEGSSGPGLGPWLGR